MEVWNKFASKLLQVANMKSHMIVIVSRQWQRALELALVVDYHVLRQYGEQCPGQPVVHSWDTSEG